MTDIIQALTLVLTLLNSACCIVLISKTLEKKSPVPDKVEKSHKVSADDKWQNLKNAFKAPNSGILNERSRIS